ncbi:tetratricopeptide repeat domain 27 [Cylindrobasidium torrendii FP15055 ss-10]|uniref:Tetratricopeptide repeat domain 27 n=1 Tax=Cylindrobasidium torrendii FP15055 ss-10 TaxID=1314674 RepID=A0A0D7AWS3_9AGAR|nr:tetratricopeptide repeat domain 27 [Cylindrobasidium torrendii FP15055 ss-10]
MTLDISLVEKSILGGSWLLEEDAPTGSTLEIAKWLVDGLFDQVLTSGPAQSLFITPTDGRTTIDALVAPKAEESAENELLRLLVAVACLHAFIQENWTGPNLTISPIRLIPSPPESVSDETLDQTSVSELAHAGEPAYHLTKHPTFLRLAQVLTSQAFLHIPSIQWWRLRIQTVHQQVLDDPVYSPTDDLGDFAQLEGLYANEPKLLGMLILEQGLHQHLLSQDASENFVRAARATNLQYELSGALGKRTKFQQTDHSQLILLAESRLQSEGATTTEDASSVGNANTLPDAIALNDDVLLEKTQFTSSSIDNKQSTLSHLDPGKQPALHPLDQSIFLGLCLNVQNTSPVHGLTTEQMYPYVDRVISHPVNWSVHTMALLLRSRLESNRTRTVERAALQLQALVDQMPTADSSVPERIRYFHSILLPSKWDMEKELAERYVGLGVLKSALEIFERLEMWEEVVRCWVTMEEREKGLRIVKDLIEGSKLEAETVISRGKDLSGERRKILDTHREAKLLCLLGDLEPEKAEEHYNAAWELSKHTSGRAMRSLGGYYFARQDFVKAVECLQKAVAINPLLSRSWFIMGCASMRLENWEVAKTAFSRCVAIDDEDAESWNNLATTYLRGGAPGNAKTPTQDQDQSFAYNVDSSKNIPYDQKMLAFRALQQGIKRSYDNWRMWSNLMIVAIDVGELATAARALGRIVEETSEKAGAQAVDEQVLERLVDGVTRAPSNIEDAVEGEDVQNAAVNPNEGHGLEKSVLSLFEKTILPRVSSYRIFRSYAKLLTWQGRWEEALKAHSDAYRCGVAGTIEKGETDVEKWREGVAEVEDIVDVLTNFGPRVDGFKWAFQAKSIVRTFMGRTRDFEDEPEWSRLTDLQEELKRQ